MKAELIEKLKSLLEAADISTVKQEVKDIRAAFKKALEEDKKTQLEAWGQAEHEEGEDFKYVAPEEEAVFKQLVEKYKVRLKEYQQKVAEEQKANLTAKKELLSKLEVLVKNEQNIGKAYQEFNEINEKWKSIGDVPESQYQDLHYAYQMLKEYFFYNINIYKELKDYDLQVNQKMKEDLVLKAKELENETSVNELEVRVRHLQKEWYEIGPSPRENYKELGDRFFGSLRKTYDKIQQHYDKIKAKMAENLIQKQELINEAKQLTELEITSHPEWVKKTEAIIALQEKWKTIGFARKKDNEIVWKEFRSLCNHFFEKKKQFYAARNVIYNDNKKKKEELIERARALQDDSNWKETTAAFIKLQEDWKNTGNALQKDEQKLWQKFRAACDIFFNRKKEHFKNRDAEQEENLHIKLKLIEDIKAYQLSGNTAKDIKALKEFSALWNTTGFVPGKNVKEVKSTYKAIMDEKFAALTEAREERSILSYELRAEALKSAPDNKRVVKQEVQVLRDKIRKLRQMIDQYENNMGFFANSSGANALKKEVEKKVKAAEREISEIKKKLELLDRSVY